jgi:hypothetical protein
VRTAQTDGEAAGPKTTISTYLATEAVQAGLSLVGAHVPNVAHDRPGEKGSGDLARLERLLMRRLPHTPTRTAHRPVGRLTVAAMRIGGSGRTAQGTFTANEPVWKNVKEAGLGQVGRLVPNATTVSDSLRVRLLQWQPLRGLKRTVEYTWEIWPTK